MENTTSHMQRSTIVLFLAIAALAVLVVWQQQQISQIKNGQGATAGNTNGAQQAPVFNQAQAVKDSLLATRSVSGVVVSSTASQVVVKTGLVNLSVLATFDFSKSQALPTTEKNLTIKITKDTKVSGGTLTAGGRVTIQTKEPVYDSKTLTALSITVSATPRTSPSTVQ